MKQNIIIGKLNPKKKRPYILNIAPLGHTVHSDRVINFKQFMKATR